MRSTLDEGFERRGEWRQFWPAAAALFALVLLFTMTVIADYDFWWHSRLGEEIVRLSTFRVADSFSYPFYGHDQFNGEWLGDIFIFSFHRWGGFFGVNLFRALICGGVLFFLYRCFREMRSSFDVVDQTVALITLSLVMVAVRFRIFPRPYLFTFLFIAIFLFLLRRYQSKGGTWILFWLPFLQLVWANTSKGCFLGPVLVGIVVVDGLLRRSFNRGLTVSFLAVVGASLLNPEGWSAYQSVLGVLTGGETTVALSMEVGEYQRLSSQLLFGHGFRYLWAFELILILTLIHLLISGPVRIGGEWLLFFAFLIPAILGVRFVALFAIACAPCCFAGLSDLLHKLAARREVVVRWLPFAALAGVVACGASVAFSGTLTPGFGPKPSTFPERALEFLEENRIQGRMFNSYPFGGYLIRQSSDRPVFIDGRGGHLYSREFMQAYRRMLVEPDSWAAATSHWGFEYAVVEYDPRSGGKHFPSHLNHDPSWALVFWDEISAVFVRRTEEHWDLIRDREYTIARPTFHDFSYLSMLALGDGREQWALEQVSREIAFNPAIQEPRLVKVLLLFQQGSPASRAQAIEELKICLDLQPDLAMEHSAMAQLLLDTGAVEAARLQVGMALDRDPNDPLAVAICSQRLNGCNGRVEPKIESR